MAETRENWCLGADDTGDITSWENFVKLKTEVDDDDLSDVHLVKCRQL